jgi:Fe-S cluster assembly protein SufD
MIAEAAAARLRVLGPPTRALEDWRFVDCAVIGRPAEHAAIAQFGDRAPAEAEGVSTIAVDDGVLSIGSGFAPFAFAWPEIADATDHQRLWAMAGGSAAIRIGRDVGDIRLVVRSSSAGASGWRLHLAVVAGAVAELRIDHRQQPGGWTAGWLDIDLGHGAQLNVIEQHHAASAVSLITVTSHLARDATLTWTGRSTGGTLLRQRLEVVLAEPGAEFDLATIDVVGSGQAHRVSRVAHAARDTRSRQLIKAIADHHGAVSCDALIAIRPGADGADAQLENRTLVQSPTARADTRPQLDIHADEVKAAHGATIGQLAEDELLYLRCRGLSAAAARDLLAQAFIAEVAARMEARG